jgi:EAL domain-containing protein (putative c-di-GMP-specific phosphodiesterase class I)
VRWDHPREGRLMPQDFLAIAEETGLIVDLGVYVMDKTARELEAWQAALEVDPPIFASVNVSSRQLLRHDLLHDVKTVLGRRRVLPGTLKLEITEPGDGEPGICRADAAAHPRSRRRPLARRFRHGLFLAVLSAALPFDTIKIDQSFVRQMGNGRPPVILRSIVQLAADLHMDVVAEGAESESDAIELYQLGCQYAQGYIFGQPMTAAKRGA